MPLPLVFEGVSKRFGRSNALADVSLTVRPGTIFGFLGPNGAGKTTAIHIAMGFLHPTSGRGELFGVPFARARAQRAQVGYVPDAPVFFAGDAVDAVVLATHLNGHSGPAVRERALQLLRWMDLPATGQDARRFSRGMQQRLALVQALVTRPRLLVLDEPTSALDPPAVSLLREALTAARSEGAAVFFSSHQLQEVELLCDEAAFVDEGRLLHTGSMASLLQEGATARITLRGLKADDSFVVRHSDAWQREAANRGDDLVFSLPVGEQRKFLEAAWLAGAELVGVERERRTLENLFAARKGEA